MRPVSTALLTLIPAEQQYVFEQVVTVVRGDGSPVGRHSFRHAPRKPSQCGFLRRGGARRRKRPHRQLREPGDHVAPARARKVAACFPGAPRGALRWSADVRAKDGAVTRNEFAALEGLPEISDDQEDCLLEALASKPYALSSFERDSARVSLVVAF